MLESSFPLPALHFPRPHLFFVELFFMPEPNWQPFPVGMSSDQHKRIHSAQKLACALNTIKSQQQQHHQQSHDLLQPFSQNCTVQIRPTGLRQLPTVWDLENTVLETQRIKFIMKE